MTEHVNSAADSWNSQELLSQAYLSAAIRRAELDVFATPIQESTQLDNGVSDGAGVPDDMPVSTA